MEVEIAAPYHATLSMLQVCSLFCTTNDFIELIDQWNSQLSEEEILGGNVPRFSERSQLPDPVALINMMIISAERNGKSVDEIQQKLDEIAFEIVKTQNNTDPQKKAPDNECGATHHEIWRVIMEIPRQIVVFDFPVSS
jgi:hypothetical protein